MRLGLALALLTTSAAHADQTKSFLAKHCISCHGPDKQKGNRRFDTLDTDFRSEANATLWQEIADQISSGEMPPDDEPRPPKSDVRRLKAFIDHGLARGTAAPSAVLRRLTALEYRNTIRDLFGIDTTLFDPSGAFPRDLITSGYLLQQCLASAQTVVEKVITPGPRPPVVKIVVDARGLSSGPGVWNFDDHADIVSRYPKDGRLFIKNLPDGVPHDGHYRLRVKVEVVGDRKGHSAQVLRIHPDEDPQLGVLINTPARGSLGEPGLGDHLSKTIALEEGKTEEVELRLWLDRGFAPVLTYPNGPGKVNSMSQKLAKQLDIPPLNKSRATRANFKGPRLRIWSIELEGPLFNQWPAEPHVRLFQKSHDAAEVLERLAVRAYRRKVTPAEIRPITTLVHQRIEAGETFHEAMKAGVKAMLCSPGFLYLEQGADGPLDNHALASRLSYFLWSSMPDARLTALADRGELTRRQVRLTEARRMLSDPKARAFTENFVDQWLGLRRMGEMPPDQKKFDRYYHESVEAHSIAETRLFFQHILDENLGLATFIDSDFTFLNQRLAEHYGLTDLKGDHFRKVSLGPRSERGGLLGHSSILTLTSNGVETSPVTRGIWVLQTILGRTPSPPPPSIKPLEPDIRGATTIREQLAKHRDVEGCADCHSKMDPYGFALETFDPVGISRVKYEEGDREVDSSGVTPDGRAFANVVELKKILLTQTDQFARSVTQKMLTYATGRTLASADRVAVDRILAQLKPRAFGLRDLVLQVVDSEPFRNK